MEIIKNGLYIISTPIGNLEDITLRAKKILEQVNFIICENPKHSLKLLNKLGIKKKLFSIHDYNEISLLKKIEKYQHNSAIALISDAGSPLISDPGFKLVNNFIEQNIYVTAVPGPSSLISSLQLSGIGSDKFVFFGFLPKSQNSINKIAKNISDLNLTSVLFVSGKKILDFLKALASNSPKKNIAICKELTKINENVYRGQVNLLIDQILCNEISLKGEFTLVIQKKDTKEKIIDEKIRKQAKKILEKFTLTEAVEIVHKLSDNSKKDIYEMLLKLKND